MAEGSDYLKVYKDKEQLGPEIRTSQGWFRLGARYGKDGWLAFLVQIPSKKETWSVQFDPAEVESILEALRHQLQVDVGPKAPSSEDFRPKPKLSSKPELDELKKLADAVFKLLPPGEKQGPVTPREAYSLLEYIESLEARIQADPAPSKRTQSGGKYEQHDVDVAVAKLIAMAAAPESDKAEEEPLKKRRRGF